jgi:NitT/TauT family transport system ATP-binding protein
MSNLPLSAAPRSPKLRVRDLCLSFGRNGVQEPILDHLNLAIYPGEFVAIVGASGCGKSTLLHILSGFLAPTSGSIEIDDEPVRGPDPRRIFVFQESGVFPWLSVEGNVGFGLSAVPRAERDQRVQHYIQLVGLKGFEHAFPQQLSGGMKQRLEVARAFAMRPDVLYMDEPFAGLDFITRMVMRRELLQIWQQERKTVLLVTHDIDEAVQLGDRVIVLSRRPARIQCDLEVGIPHPRDVSSPEYLGLRVRILDELGLDQGV